MKVTFYKVLSYWREGKAADFDKSSKFDSDIFEIFKNKIETDERIINSSRDLFVFRQNSATSDFKERPIILVSGLYAEKQFLDTEKIYNLIREQVDVFDGNKEYLLEIDDELIASKSKLVKGDGGKKYKSIIGSVAILGLLSLGVYWLMSVTPQNKQDQKVSISKKDNLHIDRTPAKEKTPSGQKKTKKVVKPQKTIHEKPKKPKWKWDKFCKTYKIKGSGYCYERYIQEKCKEKNRFHLSYKEYAKQHRDIRSCRFTGEDENLKEAIKEDRSIPKVFFKGEKR